MSVWRGYGYAFLVGVFFLFFFFGEEGAVWVISVAMVFGNAWVYGDGLSGDFAREVKAVCFDC